MATYQKVETVEARQYDGPKITVVSDKLGEQTAVAGDYLVGTERGKVTVVSKATFEAEYEAYTPTPDAEKLAASEAQAADLQKQLDVANASVVSISTRTAELESQVHILTSQITDQTQLKAEFTSTTEQLQAEQAKNAELQGKLDALIAAEAAKAEAQAKLDAASASIDNLSH